jgi:hypothetical protein
MMRTQYFDIRDLVKKPKIIPSESCREEGRTELVKRDLVNNCVLI